VRVVEGGASRRRRRRRLASGAEASGLQPILLGTGIASVAPVLAGLVVGALFVDRQRRLADPIIDLALFRRPAFSLALGANTLAFAVVFGIEVFVAQYFQLVLGYGPLAAFPRAHRPDVVLGDDGVSSSGRTADRSRCCCQRLPGVRQSACLPSPPQKDIRMSIIVGRPAPIIEAEAWIRGSDGPGAVDVPGGAGDAGSSRDR
jgi:hypothetical protein